MNLIKKNTESEVTNLVYQEIKNIAQGQESIRCFLPVGKTPQLLYQQMVQEKEFWRRKLKPIQIDEFVSEKALFHHKLRHSLLDPLKIDVEKINPQFTDQEFLKHIESVLKTPIDLALLGLGPNGHVGFHEPGLDKTFLGGRVFISEGSQRRIPEAETAEVLTFGVGSFLKVKKIILMVLGDDKKSIFNKFATSKPTVDLPATLLKEHHDFTVISIFD